MHLIQQLCHPLFNDTGTCAHLSYVLLFPQDESGYLDFREYLIGLALVSQPANTEDVMKVAFQVGMFQLWQT